MAPEPLGWGVVGTGNISTTVVEQLAAVTGERPVAVSSRTAEKAAQFAEKHGIAASYDSVAGLLADPAVEAVYIALPHSAHLDAILQALDAGKHVLCEKPMGMSAGEIERIEQHPQAKNLTIGEGFMLRHQPQWRWVEEAIRSGGLGRVRAVHAFSALTIPRSPPDPTRGALPGDGSLLLDIGCYSVHQMRTIFGAEPTEVSASIEFDDAGVDNMVSATLRFPEGTGHLTIATTLKRGRRVHILGTQGSIEMLNPVHSPAGTARVLAVLAGDDGDPKEMQFPIDQQYGLQLQEFASAVRQGRQPMVSLTNALGNARVIDAIRTSAVNGGAWTSL